MADTCICPSNTNIACSGSFGIGIYQPTCQIVPDGTRVDNPYYDMASNTTYFTYGLYTLCGEFDPIGSPGLVEDFFVPVCENIPLSSVVGVDQRLDACPEFSRVPFDFNNTGGQQPPPGFKFLRIMVGESFAEGGSGLYRIALAGNYPAEETSNNIKFTVTTTARLANLGAGAPFTFAGCPAIPRLTVTKQCMTVIDSNQATIDYSVSVNNTGDTDLADVMFSDMINFDGSNITVGTVTVNPDTISVDTSMSGVIVLSGNIGNIPIGGSVEITYSVPVVSYAEPNTYVFTNMAIARNNETEGRSECTSSVEVVSLSTDNCCDVIDMQRVDFVETINSLPGSPDTEILTLSTLSIPTGITIQLISSGNCSATFADNGEIVPLDTDVTGRDIIFSCSSMVPSGASMNYPYSIRLVAIDDFATTDFNITLTLEEVNVMEDDQILLSVFPLPNEELLEISRVFSCDN